MAMAKRAAPMRARAARAKAAPLVLEGLNLLERVAEHDARLDRILKLGELARKRLRFWRTTAILGVSLSLVLGLALWRALQRCPCDFPLNPLECQGRNGRIGI